MHTIERDFHEGRRARWILIAVFAIALQALIAVFLRQSTSQMQMDEETPITPSAVDCLKAGTCRPIDPGMLKLA